MAEYKKPTSVSYVKLSALGLKKAVPEEEDYATLSWSARNGYPRVTVYLTNKDREGAPMDWNKVIIAPMDYVMLEGFIGQMKEIVKGEPKNKIKMGCYSTKFENNKPTKDKELKGTIEFGKDGDGILYIAVLKDDKRTIKFDLKPSVWFTFSDVNGLIENPSKLSEIYANGYIKKLSDAYSHAFTQSAITTTVVDNNKSKSDYGKPKEDTKSDESDSLF